MMLQKKNDLFDGKITEEIFEQEKYFRNLKLALHS